MRVVHPNIGIRRDYLEMTSPVDPDHDVAEVAEVPRLDGRKRMRMAIRGSVHPLFASAELQSPFSWT